MEVDELLSFKPELGIRPSMGEDVHETKHKSSSESRSRKRARLDESRKPSKFSNLQREPAVSRDIPSKAANAFPKEEVIQPSKNQELIDRKMKEMENNTSDQGPLDENNLKKLILNFEKRILRNQEMRIKFPDEPKKFLESEMELNEAIEEMHVVATAPELYPVLIEMGTLKAILALLSHENTDISIAVVDLLQEMTDVEDEEDCEEAEEFVTALLQNQILATLVHSLHRLDESQKLDSDGVHNTLAIIENLFERRPDICNEANPSGLLPWLLKRLKSKFPFDGNKLYASELLAICVQSNTENRKIFPSIEGIDILLQQLAQYKRHDPVTSEEIEYMENLFDTLCSCLLLASNREPFLVAEGLQLMNLMLREKKLSRNGALKVLDHALCGPDGANNCNKFIDILGLRTIFPLFMKTPKKHAAKGLSKEQHEEHVVSIISSLFKNAKSNQKQRLINKFTENDHEKVDRILELHFKYLDRVLTNSAALEQQSKDENLEEEEMYLRRLDGGLFTLQLVDCVMIDICASAPPSVKRRVLKILNVRNASIKTIKNVIREYVSNLGEENAATSDIVEEQERILEMLDKFQN